MTVAKRLFQAEPALGNCVFNFRGSPKNEFGVYASAYWRAAKILVGQMARARGYRDTDACPIVFCYRHAAELYMKQILITGGSILSLENKKGAPAELFVEHELGLFLAEVKRVIKAVGWDWKESSKEMAILKSVKGFLRELDDIDPRSTTFRYPTKRKGEASLLPHFTFNVIEFAEKFDEFLAVLDAACTGLQAEWDERAEAWAASVKAKA